MHYFNIVYETDSAATKYYSSDKTITTILCHLNMEVLIFFMQINTIIKHQEKIQVKLLLNCTCSTCRVRLHHRSGKSSVRVEDVCTARHYLDIAPHKIHKVDGLCRKCHLRPHSCDARLAVCEYMSFAHEKTSGVKQQY